MRYFYTLLFYLLMPLIVLRLLWRSLRQPSYRKRVLERFGLYKCRYPKSLWVHAVSVGEVVAAAPLINALMAKYPTIPMVVSTMTPTGADRVRLLFGQAVQHIYLPYDLPLATKRLLQAINPVAGIMIETELWPNLYAACEKQQVPIYLMNARLSASSLKRYQYIRPLVKSMLKKIKLIAANQAADRERFIALGAEASNVVVTGNVKFDVELPLDLISQIETMRQTACHRFVWIAASTHAGEEEIVLNAHKLLCQRVQQALLILVPRHPNRFDGVAKLCEKNGLSYTRRSQQDMMTSDSSVYLGDTMGELMLLYGVADVAFVGGSLVPHGGHNMLEPALLKKPIITGPYLKNFVDISQLFLKRQALVTVNNERELAQQLETWYRNTEVRSLVGERAYEVMQGNRGALERQLKLLEGIHFGVA